MGCKAQIEKNIIVKKDGAKFKLYTKAGYPAGSRLWRGENVKVSLPSGEFTFDTQAQADTQAERWNAYLAATTK